MRVAVTAFTQRGYLLAKRLVDALREEGDTCVLALPARLAGALGEPPYESLSQWTGVRFTDCTALLFVGACGIAVRSIAPYVKDKFTDPAVVSVDEGGAWVVPLLSGHVGGANTLAKRVAWVTKGAAAISTATDINGLFSVDQWARCKGLYIDSKIAAKQVSSALLAGDYVGMKSEITLQGKWPGGLVEGDTEVGICITLRRKWAPFPTTLRLVPPLLTLGIGCRRGTSAAVIGRAVEAVLEAEDLSVHGVVQVSTIDRKEDEPGLLEFCQRWGLGLRTFTAQALGAVPGRFTPSAFVHSVTGVDNVCERAAVLAGGELIVPKWAGDGVTVAVARRPYVISFEEEESGI